MEKMEFERFCENFPVHNGTKDSPVMKRIYNDVIWKEENRIGFVCFAEREIPSLLYCAKEVEDLFDSAKSEISSIKEDHAKQDVGMMVLAAIRPFGYDTVKMIPIARYWKKVLGLRHFKNASYFAKSDKYSKLETVRIGPTLHDPSSRPCIEEQRLPRGRGRLKRKNPYASSPS